MAACGCKSLGWTPAEDGRRCSFPTMIRSLARTVAAPYATAEYDIKVQGSPDPGTDGNTAMRSSFCRGGRGRVETRRTMRPTGCPGRVPITAAGVWQHVVHRMLPYELYNMNKAVFNIIAPTCTNTITYLIDNLEFKVPTNNPPALTMNAAPPPGLHLVTAGGPGDRQIIRTVASNLKWYGRTGPVKYAFTISKFPPEILTPTTWPFVLIPYAPGSTAPDWDSTNCIRLDVQNHGTGAAYLRYKTNGPALTEVLRARCGRWRLLSWSDQFDPAWRVESHFP